MDGLLLYTILHILNITQIHCGIIAHMLQRKCQASRMALHVSQRVIMIGLILLLLLHKTALIL